MNALQQHFPASTSFPPMLFGPTQNYFSRKGWCVHDKKVNGQLTLWDLSLRQSPVSQTANSSYPAMQSADRADLDWLFAPKLATVSNRAIAYLIQLEAHETNLHICSDLRQAQITLILAQRGNSEPATVASYQVHRCHPSQVWPRRVAERKAKLAKEYDFWFDAAGNLRPDVPKKDSATTPPSLADSGAELPSNPRSNQSAPLLQFPDKETA